MGADDQQTIRDPVFPIMAKSYAERPMRRPAHKRTNLVFHLGLKSHPFSATAHDEAVGGIRRSPRGAPSNG